MEQISRAFQAELDGLADEITDGIAAAAIPAYANLGREPLRQAVRASLVAMGQDVARDQSLLYAAYWASVGQRRAEQGATLSQILEALSLSKVLIDRALLRHLADDAAARVQWAELSFRIFFDGIKALSSIFVAAREEMIRAQASQLAELSSPIIPLMDGMIVLPLVGAIDSHRAGQIMEALLQGVSVQRANVLIIDITGVPVVDTSVANYLLQAARAARLLGAIVVLTGIGPEIAQTVVQLGLDLSDLTVRGNLQAGIEYGLALRGLTIVRSVTSSAARR